MKKILFVIPSLTTGGAEKVVSKISSGLVDNYCVTILTFFEGQNEYSFDKRVKRLNLSNGFEDDYNKIGKIKRILLLRKMIKKENPNVIFPFLGHVCIYTFIASIFTKYRKKMVFTERCNPLIGKNKVIRIKYFLLKFVKKFLVQNNGQKSILSNKIQKKTIVIPNPIDDIYLNYEKNSTSCKHIVSIGRLSDQKDYYLAIDSFERILKKYPDMIYHIFGRGELKEDIENYIKERKLDNNIFLEGFTTNIDDIYINADIFLMTSKFEGLPNALAESLAVGIPCISSDCDFGPSDLIENESMGILVKEHTVEAFEKAMIQMIDNYSFYATNTQKTKQIMKEKYSVNVIVENWIDLIENF